ncbi:hypothetical protein DFH11DRAFT_1747815 [Phellopilus nigrolimitatus]|nr:hypothetical protein DFH11DRAFT_1747815 [Phellopilus nigrolimitatus]
MPPRIGRRPHATAARKRENNENESHIPRTSTPARPVARPVLYSPLPPSSPPPTSSHEKNEVTLGIDDPFGFLAAEKKIKAQKSRKILQPKAVQNQFAAISTTTSPKNPFAANVDALSETENDEREAFATPVHHGELHSTLSSAQTPTVQSPRVATPRRRRRKTRLPTTPSSLGSSSVPQTPSPVKRNLQTSSDRTEKELPRGMRHHIVKAKGKGAKSSRKKTEETLAEEDLLSATKELQELLPTRPARRPRAPQEAIIPRMPRKRVGRGATKKIIAPKRGRRRTDVDREFIGEKEGETFVLDGEEREKFEADRAARIEYFRKLDSYEITEENVYMI